MENRREFDMPTQVAYWDSDGGHYVGGIAYGNEIICGCCGGIVEIDEVYEFAPEDVNPLVVYSDWEPFDYDILADEQRYFEMWGKGEGEE